MSRSAATVIVVLLFALFALFALSALAQDGAATKAPAIALKDLKGKTVTLSDFRGKIVLLNFWATWCVPCAAEVPEMVKWQDEYRASGLRIVGITYPPTTAAKIRSFVRKYKINYPILIGTRKTKRLFEPSVTLPVTVIIDREGNIIDRIDGIIFKDEFEAKIKPLIK